MKIKDMDEKELREFKELWPKSEKALIRHIGELLNRPHDYGTCVYAVSLASIATFNYMARKLGITGFQSSCADLDILRRNRNMEGFRIINYDDLLYPQYLDSEHFPSHVELIQENKEILKKKARELLKKSNEFVHPEVKSHWEYLASL